MIDHLVGSISIIVVVVIVIISVIIVIIIIHTVASKLFTTKSLKQKLTDEINEANFLTDFR